MLSLLNLVAAFLDPIDTDALLKSLEIMGKGVLAIFIVIALIICVTMLVNKLCLKIENRKKGDNDSQQ